MIPALDALRGLRHPPHRTALQCEALFVWSACVYVCGACSVFIRPFIRSFRFIYSSSSSSFPLPTSPISPHLTCAFIRAGSCAECEYEYEYGVTGGKEGRRGLGKELRGAMGVIFLVGRLGFGYYDFFRWGIYKLSFFLGWWLASIHLGVMDGIGYKTRATSGFPFPFPFFPLSTDIADLLPAPLKRPVSRPLCCAVLCCAMLEKKGPRPGTARHGATLVASSAPSRLISFRRSVLVG